MTRLIVVRHGQSEGNAKGEFHGQYNSDLTALGHEQAERTAEFVDRYTIDAIYSSVYAAPIPRRSTPPTARNADHRGYRPSRDFRR